MGRKKLTMSEKIRRYMATHPNAKPKAIADALGVTLALVYAVKYAAQKNAAPAKTSGVDIDAVHKKDDWKTVAVVTSATPMAAAAQHDPVNHPAHYTDGGIETIDFIAAKLTKEEFIGYLKGNALKYGSRIGKKGSADVDAGKMVWYASKLREVLSPTP